MSNNDETAAMRAMRRLGEAEGLLAAWVNLYRRVSRLDDAETQKHQAMAAATDAIEILAHSRRFLSENERQ